MTRKPQTPTHDSTDTDSDDDRTDPLARPAGRRFSGNQTVLDIEAELVADGHDLPNRAIPIECHATNITGGPEAVRERIEAETAKDAPNKQTIGYLNTLLQDMEAHK